MVDHLIQWTVLGTLFFTGLTGGLGHCLGMCGPMVLMVGSRFSRSSFSFAAPRYLAFHAGRVLVYAALGAAVGLIGSLIGLGDRFFQFSAYASLIFGALIILFGLGYIRLLPLEPDQNQSSWLTTAIGRVLRSDRSWSVVPLGMLTGFLPCGLVYGTLLVAAAAGSPVGGALGMLLFGLGTVPALFIFALGAGRVGLRYRQVLLRFARILMILVGVQLALRGLASLNLIPHLGLGDFILW